MKSIVQFVVCWLLFVAILPAQVRAENGGATPEMLEQTRQWLHSLPSIKADPGISEQAKELVEQALEDPVAGLGRDGSESPVWAEIEDASDDFAQAIRQRPGMAPAMIFVSFSMPQSSLQGWLNEAALAQVPLVLQGLTAGGIMETAGKIHDLLGEDNQGAILIDPTLFRRFDIETVPTLVVASKPVNPCETRACEAEPIPEHDRVTGNITLETALRTIASGDGVAHQPAKAALARLEAAR